MKLSKCIFLVLLILSCDTKSDETVQPKSTYSIYVSDIGDFQNGPWQILKFNEFGNNPVKFISSNLSWPQDILFLKDQNIVLISNFNSGRITKYNSGNGAYLGNFATGLSQPTRMKIGPDGLLYVLSWHPTNNKVRRYKLDGTSLGEFSSVGVNSSIGIDWDKNGNFYISSFYDATVRKFNSQGIDQGILINSNLVGPTNIWFNVDGDLLVLDYNGGSLKKFSSSGAYKNVFISGLSEAEGYTYLSNGNLLIGNGKTSAIKMYSPSGSFIKDIIGNGSGNLLRPNAIVIR